MEVRLVKFRLHSTRNFGLDTLFRIESYVSWRLCFHAQTDTVVLVLLWFATSLVHFSSIAHNASSTRDCVHCLGEGMESSRCSLGHCCCSVDADVLSSINSRVLVCRHNVRENLLGQSGLAGSPPAASSKSNNKRRADAATTVP